jgi:vitamin-K-epoxide reductase (warfarin-sensitive)
VQPAVSDATISDAGPNRLFFTVIAVLSLAGMIVSALSLQRHYAKSATEFCDFSQRFSCDIVNRSQQSSIVGIPVAGIGVAGYAVLFFLSVFRRSCADTPIRLLVAATAGLIFALYLTYVEAYVLETWCILCLISLGLIFLIAVSSAMVKLQVVKA